MFELSAMIFPFSLCGDYLMCGEYQRLRRYQRYFSVRFGR